MTGATGDRLTTHFRLAEFAVSREYPHLAGEITFDAVERERLRFACAALLEPIRAQFARPVHITSGKRTPALNRAVGGHPDSHHLFRGDTGAVDLVIADTHPANIAAWIVANLRVHSCIVYGSRGFLHLSFPTAGCDYNLIHYLP